LYQYNLWHMSLYVGEHFMRRWEMNQESYRDARSRKYKILSNRWLSTNEDEARNKTAMHVDTVK